MPVPLLPSVHSTDASSKLSNAIRVNLFLYFSVKTGSHGQSIYISMSRLTCIIYGQSIN